jgi:tetratricopeptide (TPR) repeat protein
VRRRPDRRLAGLAATALLVTAGGVGLARLGGLDAPPPTVAVDARRQFEAAVLLLHARRHDEAATLLTAAIAVEPDVPDSHVNLGFARLGQQRPAQARAAFEQAIALRPQQANAYYGLAMAHEAGGDLALALGAMRTYLHLAQAAQPHHLARARAALWEWEQALAARRAR